MCTSSGLLSDTSLRCVSVVRVEASFSPVEQHQSQTLVVKKNTTVMYKLCLLKYFSSVNAVKALPMQFQEFLYDVWAVYGWISFHYVIVHSNESCTRAPSSLKKINMEITVQLLT